VSQYEIGKTVPSTEILLKMSALASISLPENDELQTAIVCSIARRIGVYDSQAWEAHLKDGTIRVLPRWSGLLNVQTEFIEEVKAFLTENPLTFEVPSHLVRILRLYRENHRAPGVVNIFRRAADYIEVELKLRFSAGQAPPVASLARDEKRLAALDKRLAKLKAAEAASARASKAATKPARTGRPRRSTTV
jgi:hypothetical protein